MLNKFGAAAPTHVRLDPREQVLQVVDVAAHDLHVLQPILRRVCAAKGEDGCALWQPSDMDLRVWRQYVHKHQMRSQLRGRQSTGATSSCGAGVATDARKQINVAIRCCQCMGPCSKVQTCSASHMLLLGHGAACCCQRS